MIIKIADIHVFTVQPFCEINCGVSTKIYDADKTAFDFDR